MVMYPLSLHSCHSCDSWSKKDCSKKEEKLQVFHSPLFERIEKSVKEKNNE